MIWRKVKLKQVLKQYRIEHIVQNDFEYKQVTISKYDGVTFRGTKIGKEIGRKRQFQIDLKKYPNTLMFVRQGVQDGSIGIAPLEVDGCIATENMPMFSVDGINLEYLKFILKSPYFYNELKKIQTTGSAQKSIHEREILEIEIPFPEIKKQEETVKLLSIKKNYSIEIFNSLIHQLTLVKKLRQQLLQEVVQGKLVQQDPNDEPASELLKRIKAEKAKLIAEKKIKKDKLVFEKDEQSIPFELPKNWSWCKLGELAILNARIGWKGLNASEYKKEGPLFLSVHSLNYGDYVDYSQAYHISQDRYNESPEIMLKENDILICKDGAGIGKLGIIKNLNEQATTNSSLLVIRCNNNLNIKYIYYYLISQHFQKIVQDRIMGATTPHLYQRDLTNFYVALPPITEQNRIVNKLDELIKYCNDLEISIKKSEVQNEKLLQQVLREALKN